LQDTGFHGTPLIAEELGDWHSIPQDNCYCTPHGLQNKVKDLLAVLGNTTKGFTTKRKEAERKAAPSRFLKWESDQFEFVATKEGRERADRIVRDHLRQAVSKKSHDPVRPPFAKTGEVQMKIHDAVVFCSRYGAYIVMQMGLPNEVEELIVDYLLALEATTLKWYKVLSGKRGSAHTHTSSADNRCEGHAQETDGGHR
jgi:hypothetical protein